MISNATTRVFETVTRSETQHALFFCNSIGQGIGLTDLSTLTSDSSNLQECALVPYLNKECILFYTIHRKDNCQWVHARIPIQDRNPTKCKLRIVALAELKTKFDQLLQMYSLVVH